MDRRHATKQTDGRHDERLTHGPATLSMLAGRRCRSTRAFRCPDRTNSLRTVLRPTVATDPGRFALAVEIPSTARCSDMVIHSWQVDAVVRRPSRM